MSKDIYFMDDFFSFLDLLEVGMFFK